MTSGPIISWQTEGQVEEAMTDIFSPWVPKPLPMVTAAIKLKMRVPKPLPMVTAAIKLKDACSLERKLRQT